METGQMNMMMQLPVGAPLPVAMPVPSAVAGAPAESRKSGESFAGVLFGLAPSIASRASVMAGTAKAANDAASDTVEEVIAVPQPEATPDLLALLMASSGSDSGTSVAVTVADDKDLPSGQKEQDSQILQNVAIWTAGMQLVQPQTDNGRMPVTSDNSGKEMQDSTVNGIMGSAAVTPGSSHSRTDMELPGKNAPGIIAERGASAGTTGQHPLESAPMEGPGVPMVSDVPPPMQMAGVTPVVTLPPGAESPVDAVAVKQEVIPLVEQAGARMAQASQVEAVPVFNPAGGGQRPEPAPQSVFVTPEPESSTGPVAAKKLVSLPVMPAETGSKTKLELQTVTVKSGPETSAPKAAGTEAAAAPPVASVTTETAPTREISASRGDMRTEVSALDAHASTRRLTEVNTAGVSAASETGAVQSVVAGAGELAPELHDAVPVLPRASVVAAVRADTRQRVDHASGKPPVATESGLKAGPALQDTEGKGSLSDGSDSGSPGKGFAEFMPKPSETLTTVTHHVPGGHQTFSTEALSSTPSQQFQAETPRPDGHEQVARQVREQLASHDMKPGSDQITFKLSPDHLGDIKVNLRLDDQRLKVEIVAETRVARESLLQHVDSLKESLARQNISIEKFDVTTGGNSAGSQGNNANAQGEWRELAKNRQSQQWLSSGGYRTPQAEVVPSPQMYLARTEHAMVDLHF